jgi:nicotinamide mononucleotide transporter
VIDGVRDGLNATAFDILGAPTTWTEVVSFVTGALCVWLVAVQHPANWPIGIANASTFLALFWLNGLFADGALQIVYIVLGFYGWWAWLHDGRTPEHRRTELAVSTTTSRQWAQLAAATIAGTASLSWFLATWTSSTVPFWDGAATALSLAATWGQCRKKVESWWLWIAADLIYIPLLAYKGLWLTAILYVGFLALCVVGLRSWRADLDTPTADGEPALAAAGVAMVRQ